jgi:hypothetical protein
VQTAEKPKVRSYIAHLMAPNVDKIDADYIRRQISHEALTAPHSRDRLKGWELLGRGIGLFTEVHDVTLRGQSLEQLLASLAKINPEAAATLAPLLGLEPPSTDPSSN